MNTINIESIMNFYEFHLLNEDRFTLKDLNISPRVYNYWYNNGLSKKRTEGKRIQFNFIEYIWLKIINELRQMGISIGVIKKLQKELFKEVSISEIKHIKSIEGIKKQCLKFIDDNTALKEQEKEQFFNIINLPEFDAMIENFKLPLLHTLIVNSLLYKQDAGIIIYSNGEVQGWLDEIYTKVKNAENIFYKTHIYISLTAYIFEFISDETKEQFILPLNLLNDDELELIQHIRKGNLVSIKIHLENNKIKMFELTSFKNKMDVETRLLEVIKKEGYQDIEFTTQNGKITKFYNTIKIKKNEK